MQAERGIRTRWGRQEIAVCSLAYEEGYIYTKCKEGSMIRWAFMKIFTFPLKHGRGFPLELHVPLMFLLKEPIFLPYHR